MLEGQKLLASRLPTHRYKIMHDNKTSDIYHLQIKPHRPIPHPLMPSLDLPQPFVWSMAKYATDPASSHRGLRVSFRFALSPFFLSAKTADRILHHPVLETQRKTKERPKRERERAPLTRQQRRPKAAQRQQARKDRIEPAVPYCILDRDRYLRQHTC